MGAHLSAALSPPTKLSVPSFFQLGNVASIRGVDLALDSLAGRVVRVGVALRRSESGMGRAQARPTRVLAVCSACPATRESS